VADIPEAGADTPAVAADTPAAEGTREAGVILEAATPAEAPWAEAGSDSPGADVAVLAAWAVRAGD